MQEQYDKFREYVEELEKCRKELENLKFENNSIHEKLYRLEMEKTSLKEKVEKLTEYIQNIEQVSRSKDEMILSLSRDINSYRKLLMTLVILLFLLLMVIVYLSMR
ncbi:MAG: hypothetical protein ACK42C_03955 [Aquificaceae bacterium]|jgi:predicted nuclease with TOPRIM domain|uniref:hypothetical protein n=1 Tax=Hydrogenobacter sp. Uz 6-8 TaxID=3384828 RepID=UPI000F0E8B64|nr:MAG: hypothetical protein D6804_07200 [Aquificota bacterium]